MNYYKYFKYYVVAVAALAVVVFISFNQSESPQSGQAQLSSADVDYYSKNVQPIFDNRCVACHSCYNSPCQLKLSSFEGTDRGLHETLKVYGKRTESQKPTRLFEDAQSTDEWHKKFGFKSVTQGGVSSILAQALEAKNSEKVMPTTPAEESRVCTTDRAKALAMPYGLPALEEGDQAKIAKWIEMGVPPSKTPRVVVPENIQKQVDEWQQYFNRTDTKSKLISRYIFEHLFLAHIYFDDEPIFFRMIRSKTDCSNPVDVATVRPYDDPGKFKYCLRPIQSAIVHKDHITYPLSGKKERFNELFDNTDWNIKERDFPSYVTKKAANPFETFKTIPAKSRYQFLLDNALYFVRTFIRGPVCKGGTAVNVINEHFHVMFVDPEAYPDKEFDAFVNGNASGLNVPASFGSDVEVNVPIIGALAEGISDKGAFYEEVKGISKIMLGTRRLSRIFAMTRGNYVPSDGLIHERMQYRKARQKFFEKHHPKGYTADHIWDGDGQNKNALLTIFRHFDSASVSYGAIGPTPKTMWVIDYPLLEGIYYNLVAGFDVFGDAGHQAATRYFKSAQRLDGEEHFLYLVPKNMRKAMRLSWYKDGGKRPTRKILEKVYPIGVINHERGEKFGVTSETPVRWSDTELREARETIFKSIYDKHFASLFGPFDQRQKDVQAFAEIIDKPAKSNLYVSFFPDLSFVKVGNEVYSLVRNKQHFNVSWVMNEDKRRDHDNDILMVLKGYIGSYPIQFFDVGAQDVSKFVAAIKSIKSQSDYEKVLADYLVNRDSPNFWNIYDFMNSKLKEDNPIEAGLFDLNRYGIATEK